MSKHRRGSCRANLQMRSVDFSLHARAALCCRRRHIVPRLADLRACHARGGRGGGGGRGRGRGRGARGTTAAAGDTDSDDGGDAAQSTRGGRKRQAAGDPARGERGVSTRRRAAGGAHRGAADI